MADPLDPDELPDVQGLLASGYPQLHCAAYRLLRVLPGENVAARAWLWLQLHDVTPAATKGSVPNAGDKRETTTALNIAFTHAGLHALGLPAETLATFPNAFVEGMSSQRRARILGDSPERWMWGGPPDEEARTLPVHVLLLMYDETDDKLFDQLKKRAPGSNSGFAEVLTLRAGTPRVKDEALAPDADVNDNREHFGFVDAIGQPFVRGLHFVKPEEDNQEDDANELQPGEFVLGHRDELKSVSPSPTISDTEATSHLASVTGDVTRRDLGRNGSYLVFRHLTQEVVDFWRAIGIEARMRWPDDPHGPQRLAAKMVGRWRCGAPLVLHDKDPEPNDPANPRAKPLQRDDFEYTKLDPNGDRCPLGAHIRRANPRDALGPDNDAALESVKRHRLLRRGRSFGDRIEDNDLAEHIADPDLKDRILAAVPKDPRRELMNKRRGLYFICLVADIERQFEFVQQTWLNNPAFSRLANEVDPLVGVHGADDGRFTVEFAPFPRRVSNMTSHVQMRGGAYFFLPSIRALEVITAPGSLPPQS